MAKPTEKMEWTVGNPTARTEPSAGKKTDGWDPNERPAREFMNWLFHNTQEWLDYFETETDALLALQSTYDVVIGVGGTHATLNDAIADVGLGENQRVLIKDPATLTTTQVLSKNGWEIFFKPLAIYSQGAVTTPGIQITGSRVRLHGGRFTDFDGGTDVAIELTAAARNCMIYDNMFFNTDVTIQDDGVNTALNNNLVEV